MPSILVMMNKPFGIRKFFSNPFEVDIRALSLMRIGIAIILLIDLLIRYTDIDMFYTDMGVVPLACLFQYSWNIFHTSLFTISGFRLIQLILFLVTGASHICLLLGYKTRLFTILSWFLLLSIHNRNPFILQGGDDLLRLLLFWGIFLPWGNRYSLDKVFRVDDLDDKKNYFGLASVGYVMLIISVYFFSALQKSGLEWTTTGEAIYNALSLDQMVLPLGKLIYPYPLLLKVLTFSVLYIELFIPLLLLIPFARPFFSVIVIVIISFLHIGISLTLFVGLFYIISIASLLALLPAIVMDSIDRNTREIRSSVSIKLLSWQNDFPFKLVAHSYIKIPSFLHGYSSIGKEAILSFFIFYCILWNLGNTEYLKNIRLTPVLSAIGHFLRLDQNWGMFAPGVFKDDGWYILEGSSTVRHYNENTCQEAEIQVNEKIDLFRSGQKVNYSKPESIVSEIKNDRWRKYLETILFVDKSYLRGYFCNYSLRVWNENHPDKRLVTLDVIYMKEVTQPDYKLEAPTREVLCSCSQ